MRILVLCAVAMLLAAGHSLDGVETMVEENLPENTVTAGLETHSVGESTTVKGGFDGTTFACPSGFNVAEELSGHPSGTHTGEGGISISVARFKCVCSITNPLPTCTREDPQLGTQTNVLAFYEFKAGVPDVNGEAWNALSDALKVATIDKIKELFEAHQEARSADMPTGGERRSQSTELGANAESTSGSTYVQIGSGGLCLGGTQLFAAGPNWEVAAGIVACREKCDSNTLCNGFVWWEDFGCRTYTSCDSKSSSGSANHVWRRESSTPGGFPDFPAFTGFGPNFCSDYPINSAQRSNPGPQGWQTLWSTEDGSCLDTVNVWEPAKTERGKDDATNPCSGVTANHNAVVYYDDWLSWVPDPTCKTAYGDDSKCSDWGVKVNHQITSFGDIMRIGWGDAMSTSTGQDPAGVQNIPNVGAINYPLFLNYLKDKFRLMGCPESELPFRVTLGRHTDWWVGSYGIKKSDMTKAHILELSFPCGGPSWSTNCVAPTQEVANKWWWTTFRFAMQIQVGSAATGSENGENWSVLGKGSSVPLYTWGCGSNGVKGRPTPLSFCNGGTNGPLHYDKLDSIIREAIAHARFEIAKTLAHGGSTTETYDNCADTINCGATYNNIYNRCHHREFTQDPRIPLEYCKKSCALHGGTGNC